MTVAAFRAKRSPLSIRRQLILAHLAVLVASLIFGAGISGWLARAKLQEDMATAVNVARLAANGALQAIPESQRSRDRIENIVRLFDGDTHIRALMYDKDDRPVTSSYFPTPNGSPPQWVARLLTPPSFEVHLIVVDVGEIRLAGDYGHELAAAWRTILVNLATLTLFFSALIAVVFSLINRLLLPVRALMAAQEKIARGDYSVRVPVGGGAELTAVASGFNIMADTLSVMKWRTDHLSSQLATVQDEERAELARDLHDDIGPLLFAIDVDITTIKAMLPDDPNRSEAAILERAGAIQSAVAEAKRHVRAILSRLRPGVVVQLGLRQSLEDLVQFWTTHHPAVEFALRLSDDSYSPRIDTALHAVIREAVNNALKHGKPSRIDVEIYRGEDGWLRLKIADNGGEATIIEGKGFGITGMRERIAMLGGRIDIAHRLDQPGIVVTAKIPSPSHHPDPGGETAS